MSEELNANPEELNVNNEPEQTGDEVTSQVVEEMQEATPEVEEQPAKKKVKFAPMATADLLKDFEDQG